MREYDFIEKNSEVMKRFGGWIPGAGEFDSISTETMIEGCQEP